MSSMRCIVLLRGVRGIAGTFDKLKRSRSIRLIGALVAVAPGDGEWRVIV